MDVEVGFVLYGLYALSELQRLDTLFNVSVLSTDGANQGGLRVTAKTFLKQVGQFAVSEGDVRFTFA